MMKLNSCDIKSFKNILSMFNGSAQFIIENPWFEYKSYAKRENNKENFMTFIKNDYILTPRILLKNLKTK